MSDTEQTREDKPDQDETSEAEKAEQAKERYESAQEKMKELEEMDEPPSNLEDWPDDQAKYVTYGGPEGGDHSYEEGPEAKLGPPDLERRQDGSVRIEGKEVDNPDDYKTDPVPGGPTDPNTTVMPGEKKKWEKMERMYEDEGKPDALKKAEEQRGESGGGEEGEGKGDESEGEEQRSEG